MVIDYLSISNDELRRAVAECFGLVDVKRLDMSTPAGDVWLARLPNGRQTAVPDWPADLNVALTLISDGLLWSISNEPDGTIVAYLRDPMQDTDFNAESDTAARAVCFVWLAWKDKGLT